MATSRERLLESGITIALDGEAEALRRAIPVDAVCKHAGLSRRTFYDHFPSGTEFNAAVVDQLRAAPTSAMFPVDEALEVANDLTEFSALLAAHVSEALRTRLRSGFWVEHDDSPDVVVAALVEMIEESGFVPVHSLEFGEIRGVLSWIIAGIGTQWAIPDLDVAARAIATFLSGAVVRVDQVDEYQSTILFAELRAGAMQPTSGLIANLRRLVVDAAMATIGDKGLNATRLEDIALDVGISAGAIASSLGNVSDLAAVGVAELSYALLPQLAVDVEEDLGHQELFDRHMDRVSDLFLQHPAVAEIAVIADLAGDSRPLDSLVTSSEMLIEKAKLDRLRVGQALAVVALSSRRGDSIPRGTLWSLVSS